MRFCALLFAAAVWLTGIPLRAAPESDTAKEILALEQKAMDGWISGNPEPALAIMDPGVSYFHIMTAKRLDGIAAVRSLFEQYRGQALYDSYTMDDPKVITTGDMAVLTYILSFKRGGASSRWNGTQVYRKTKDGWRIVHSHWSQTRTD